jgi:hypothetical protein
MKTITTNVRDLTVLENHFIMTATDYNILPDGAIMLHVPSPDGYAKWHSDDKDFITNAESHLSNLSVNKLKKWKPSQFINSKEI